MLVSVHSVLFIALIKDFYDANLFLYLFILHCNHFLYCAHVMSALLWDGIRILTNYLLR